MIKSNRKHCKLKIRNKNKALLKMLNNKTLLVKIYRIPKVKKTKYWAILDKMIKIKMISKIRQTKI